MKAATRSPKFVSENEVRVTKAFLKNAMVFGTPEYKLWKEIRLDCPNAVMITKDIKRNPNKRTYRNMTYKNMVAYITVHEGANAENVLAEFEIAKASSAIQQSPYRHVLASKVYNNRNSNPNNPCNVTNSGCTGQNEEQQNTSDRIYS